MLTRFHWESSSPSIFSASWNRMKLKLLLSIPDEIAHVTHPDSVFRHVDYASVADQSNGVICCLLVLRASSGTVSA